MSIFKFESYGLLAVKLLEFEQMWKRGSLTPKHVRVISAKVSEMRIVVKKFEEDMLFWMKVIKDNN
ncbi:hypothetical protein TSUD_105750 [Trifolium subterraneum]|uniref:Uncharacterized protein n=1 Tax=Trifolium subterraneum TaxID=3900 RepID=A0A2Z6MLN9_TRISU|nr:hypothetical protein TSUD_105750 [Trifolium subterraneum]